MKTNISDYYTAKEWDRIRKAADKEDTPVLIVSLDKIKDRFTELQASIPPAKIYYAVKANPADEVVSMLKDMGSYFDVASIFES